MRETVINVGVVLDKNGKVLIEKRRKTEKGNDNSKLTWVFPGGKQNAGETRNERVRKEVLSETGYLVKPLKQISVRKHPQLPVTVTYHYCELLAEKPIKKPGEPKEISQIEWVKPEGLKDYFTTHIDPKVAKFLKIKAF